MIMEKKVVLVAFNGEAMCFVHVLLNALDMAEKGYDVKVVIEGSATKTAVEMNDLEKTFGKLYLQIKEKGLIDCACQACSSQMGVLDEIKEQGLPLCSEMKGHPSLARYMEEGYRVITF